MSNRDLAVLERLATAEIEAAANPVVQKIPAAKSALELILVTPGSAPVPSGLFFEDRESGKTVHAALIASVEPPGYVATFALQEPINKDCASGQRPGALHRSGSLRDFCPRANGRSSARGSPG